MATGRQTSVVCDADNVEEYSSECTSPGAVKAQAVPFIADDIEEDAELEAQPVHSQGDNRGRGQDSKPIGQPSVTDRGAFVPGGTTIKDFKPKKFQGGGDFVSDRLPEHLQIPKQYDILFYCIDEDLEAAQQFQQQYLEDFRFKDGSELDIFLFSADANMGGTLIEQFDEALENSTHIFLYITKRCGAHLEAMRNIYVALWNTINDRSRKYSVVPIFHDRADNMKKEVPASIRSIFGFEMPKMDKYSKRRLEKQIKDKQNEKRRRYDNYVLGHPEHIAKVREYKLEEALKEANLTYEHEIGSQEIQHRKEVQEEIIRRDAQQRLDEMKKERQYYNLDGQSKRQSSHPEQTQTQRSSTGNQPNDVDAERYRADASTSMSGTNDRTSPEGSSPSRSGANDDEIVRQEPNPETRVKERLCHNLGPEEEANSLHDAATSQNSMTDTPASSVQGDPQETGEAEDVETDGNSPDISIRSPSEMERVDSSSLSAKGAQQESGEIEDSTGGDSDIRNPPSMKEIDTPLLTSMTEPTMCNNPEKVIQHVQPDGRNGNQDMLKCPVDELNKIEISAEVGQGQQAEVGQGQQAEVSHHQVNPEPISSQPISAQDKSFTDDYTLRRQASYGGARPKQLQKPQRSEKGEKVWSGNPRQLPVADEEVTLAERTEPPDKRSKKRNTDGMTNVSSNNGQTQKKFVDHYNFSTDERIVPLRNVSGEERSENEDRVYPLPLTPMADNLSLGGPTSSAMNDPVFLRTNDIVAAGLNSIHTVINYRAKPDFSYSLPVTPAKGTPSQEDPMPLGIRSRRDSIGSTCSLPAWPTYVSSSSPIYKKLMERHRSRSRLGLSSILEDNKEAGILNKPMNLLFKARLGLGFK